jgi:hypothetical protein
MTNSTALGSLISLIRSSLLHQKRQLVAECGPLKVLHVHAGGIAQDIGSEYTFGMDSSDELDELIEEATVDAYDELEQRAGFYAMLDDNLGFPFSAKIVGEKVTVTGLDMATEERILAVCENKGKSYRVDILDLEITDRKVVGGQWLAAYREWSYHG